MKKELLFWGIDEGYINKEEASKCKDFIRLGNSDWPIDLPETNQSIRIDDKYKKRITGSYLE